MYHTVTHSLNRSELGSRFQPIQQKKDRHPVIGNIDTVTIVCFSGSILEDQPRVTSTNTINLTVKPSFQDTVNLIQSKLDARRSAVDRQDT
jgi:hypothetical protein